MDEEWRKIQGFPDYAVSSHGRVKRIAYTKRYRTTGRVLNSKPGPGGYVMVSLYENGKHCSRSVHSIVCEAFHGPRPSCDHQVAHNDGSRGNNHAHNLRWATREENMDDKRRHGTMPTGDHHHSRINPSRLARGERNGGGGKLTEHDVRAIREDGRLHRVIAEQYGVVKSMVSMIKRRETWKHVQGECK